MLPEDKYICIVADHTEERIDYIQQLLTKGRILAKDSRCKLLLVCFGDKLDNYYQFTEYSGELTIYQFPLADMAIMKNILIEVFKKIVNLKLVIFMASKVGKELAARLSVVHNAGLVAECLEINYILGDFVFTRTAMSSSKYTDIICFNHDFGMCTIRENVFKKEKHNSFSEYKLLEEKIESNALEILYPINRKKTVLIQNSREDFLDEKEIIFGCGRGVLQSNCLDLVRRVAEKYSAGIACTKTLVENGIMKKVYQVGQSGKSVTPYIYVALGISGACQHMSGIKNADIIIAINNDNDAPIFEYSNYKVVKDVKEVLEALLNK